MEDVVILFRPTGPRELQLVAESGYRRWPPRLPEQPIFYPVTNEAYARQIAERWNVKESGSGFVTRFAVRKEFLDRYERRVVGAREHEEYWIPAEDLEAFNDAIVGEIEVIASFNGTSSAIPVLVIDGENFATLEEFYAEVTRGLIPSAIWGHNLDAFNDILRGGFGTPDRGFVLRWLHHATSRERLGYPETVRQLGLRLQRCHPSNRARVAEELDAAAASEGPTVFDWLIEIIRIHGPSGTESEDGVLPLLE